MSDLFSQLGINLPMLIAQAINFGILLTVLTLFVYRPLMKAMEERRKKIELGIRGAEMAEKKIAEAEEAKSAKLAEADNEAVKIIGEAEKRAGERGQQIVKAAEAKGEAVLSDAAQTAERKAVEEMEKLSQEAAKLVKAAIIKAVELSPEQIDEKLIEQAVAEVRAHQN